MSVRLRNKWWRWRGQFGGGSSQRRAACRRSLVDGLEARVLLTTVYVANHGGDAGNPNTIEQFTAAGVGSVFANTGSANYPTGLAFDRSGNLYTTIDIQPPTGTGSIEKFTPGGGESVFVSSGLSNPEGLAFDASGNLYVANSYGNTIDKITPGGVASVFASSGLDYPECLAFDHGGNLYATNWKSSTIEKFTTAGVGSVFASVSTPFGLAFDASGNLYVSSGKAIEEFTSAGVESVFATTSVNSGTLAFDSTGNLYAILGNAIEEYTPSGVGSDFASQGLSTPTFIAITPGLSTPPTPKPPPTTPFDPTRTPAPMATPTAAPSPSLTPASTGPPTLKPAAAPRPAPRVQFTRTFLSIKPRSMAPGQPVILTARVADLSHPQFKPIGAVTFMAGGTRLGIADLRAGEATLNTAALPTGGVRVRAVYLGTTDFSQSRSATLIEPVNARRPAARSGDHMRNLTVARTTLQVQLLRRQDVVNAVSGAVMIASTDRGP